MKEISAHSVEPRGWSDPLAALATKTQRSIGDMENERKLASCGSECFLDAFQLLPYPNNPPKQCLTLELFEVSKRKELLAVQVGWSFKGKSDETDNCPC